MSDVIHLISLGAGVQSSTMALMAAAGEIAPAPVAAIFADTQAEPPSVYRWLDWLEQQLPFPVVRVTHGNLGAEIAELHQRKDGNGYWSYSGIPAYVDNPDGTTGHMMRQCTADFKLKPLMREAKKRIKAARSPGAVQWIGITIDEAHRMKPSREKKITSRWPLIELNMTRHDCLRWMEAHGYPRPPRSACAFCPYHSDAEWRRLKTEEPDAFAYACEIDEAYREAKRAARTASGVPYVHRSLRPLREVDFFSDVERGQGVLNLFGNECEGMCGV